MKSISERINEGMSIRNMKQVDIIEKTGINKGALSSYISGKYEPKQTNIYKLAKALDVNEAWLMGYNVPMERTPSINFDTATDDTEYNRAIIKIINKETPTNSELKALEENLPEFLRRVSGALQGSTNDIDRVLENRLTSSYRLLNSAGKKEAIKRVDELTYIPAYRNEEDNILNAAHAIDGATEEDKQHDEDIMNDESLWE